MTYDAFIATVERGAHIPSDEAQRAACATLQTLSERISQGETADIRDRLPEQLRSCLRAADAPASFPADDFLRRVAERTGLDQPSAERDARAVFSALFRSLGPEEFQDLRTELPDDFDPLLDAALRDTSTLVTGETEAQPGLDSGQFLQRVADRLDVDRERARQATDAVLEVLAVRISQGEVEDLARRLPRELRVPLERGVAQNGPALRMSPTEFLREVARREGVSADEAADATRSVVTTLREAAGEQEFDDAIAQLPDEYAPLLRYQG